MNFIPAWSVSLLFLILVLWVLALALGKAAANGDRVTTSIHDVPCQSCQRGYGEQHECEEPDRCACDQEVKHVVTYDPSLCVHRCDPSLCVYCWLEGGKHNHPPIQYCTFECPKFGSNR